MHGSVRSVVLWTVGGILLAAAILSISLQVLTAGSHRRYPMCQTNMHNITMALKMYQQDYKACPETLGGHVQTNVRGTVPFESAQSRNALCPEYIRDPKCFHCPLSKTMDTSAVVELPVKGKIRRYYAYDSYDTFVPEEVHGIARTGPGALRYNISWADNETAVARYAADPSQKDSPTLRAYDFKRQLKFKYLSDDTVITWCNYHDPRNPKAKVPVLFADGHADLIPADVVEKCRWRCLPTP